MAMMRDANGREMKTGDIVRISGAYFKVDNGLYFVSYSPGDPSWSGSDYSLRKIKRNGELTSGSGVAFWPLLHFCSDRSKNAAAYDWDEKNAKIEVVDGIDKSHIKAYFSEKAKNEWIAADRAKWDWGRHSSNYLLPFKIHKFFRGIAESM